MARVICELDSDWFFHRGDFENFDLALNAEEGWLPVKVPHDWDIEGPFLETNKSGESGGYAPGGIGWYKREFAVKGPINGKTLLYFDGIYMRATIWVNGKEAGTHLYGYTPFILDITHLVNRDGFNNLVVRVDNSKQPNCRWYSGSGIYRRAWLLEVPAIHVQPWGLFVSTPSVDADEAVVRVQVEMENGTRSEQNLRVVSKLIDDGGHIIPTLKAGTQVTVPPGGLRQFVQEISVLNPRLWTLEDPHLYRMVTCILPEVGDTPIDEVIVRFGIRSLKYDGKGFWLNGKNVLMKGVCLHHDGGCVGAAVPPAVWERRLRVLKDIGCNAIRTAHNPPASDFLDICDELGFLVINEAFDAWTLPKKRHDWVLFHFKKQWEGELANFVRRDRNHPSVVLWSLGNEIPKIPQPKMKNLYARMAQFLKNIDPTRPMTTCLGPNNAKNEIKRMQRDKAPFLGDLVDVYCTNYTEAYMTDFHKFYPDIATLSTEAYHYWRRKNPRETHLPPKQGHSDYTGARNPWFDVLELEYLAGLFLWVGIEYLGEVRDPYPYHGRTNAPIRITGFPKPQAGYLASLWRDDPQVFPVVLDEQADIPRGKIHFDYPKVVDHWTFPGREGEEMVVFTYTNCESVELILNGESLGEQRRAYFPNNEMRWIVPYTPGELQALGKKNDDIVAKSLLKTAGVPAKILLVPDKSCIEPNGRDCVNIEVLVVDENGFLVPTATSHIDFRVTGLGNLIGVDSGNLASHDSYQNSSCQAYWGQCLVIIQAEQTPGVIQFCAESKNLPPAEIQIRVTTEEKRSCRTLTGLK